MFSVLFRLLRFDLKMDNGLWMGEWQMADGEWQMRDGGGSEGKLNTI